MLAAKGLVDRREVGLTGPSFQPGHSLALEFPDTWPPTAALTLLWAPCCSDSQLPSWSLGETVHRGRAWDAGKLRSRSLLPRKRCGQGKVPVGLADGQPSFEAGLQDSKSCPALGRRSQRLPGYLLCGVHTGHGQHGTFIATMQSAAHPFCEKGWL